MPNNAGLWLLWSYVWTAIIILHCLACHIQTMQDYDYYGHMYGLQSKFLYVDVSLCHSFDDWIDPDVAINDLEGTVVDYIYIDAEYDYNDLENPVHYSINYENLILIDKYYTTEHIYHLSPSIAYSSDSTTTVFYDVEHN